MRRREFERSMERWDREFREWREEVRRRWEESERRFEEWHDEYRRWSGSAEEWRERDARFWAERNEATQRWHEETRRRWERWDAWVRQCREEVERQRTDQKGRFDAIDVAIETDKRMTRELLVQAEQDRERLKEMQHGIRTTTEGLLRVLDEFRRGDGPSAAGA